MITLTLDLPDSVLAANNQSVDDFVREAKFVLAAKLFDLGRLSSGRAAALCDMERVDFLLELGRIGISAIQLDESEYEKEFGRG